MYEDNEYSEERNPCGSNGHRVHDSIGKQAGSFPPCAEAQSRNRSGCKGEGSCEAQASPQARQAGGEEGDCRKKVNT